jgi:hypothetical protein
MTTRAARATPATRSARLLALPFALLFAGCATRDFGPLDETWFACTRNRQCTLVEDPTCELVPINKEYAQPFVEYVRLSRPLEISRAPCAKQAVRYRAVCQTNRCTSESRGLVRRRATRERP